MQSENHKDDGVFETIVGRMFSVLWELMVR